MTVYLTHVNLDS